MTTNSPSFETLRDELRAVLNTVKSDGRPRISEAGLRALGLSDDTRFIHSQRDNLPITHELHQLPSDIWIDIERHTNQQGDQPTIHYVNGIGALDVTAEPLDLDALRERLETKSDDLTRAVDAIVDAMHEINQLVDLWILDEIGNRTTWAVVTGTRIYAHCHVAGYHWADSPIDFDEGDRQVVRNAIKRTQGARGSTLTQYDFPHMIHFVLDYELDASDVTLDDLVS